ncbi:MAG: ATP-binding protein, partial [Myxococcota bacterium]
HHRRSGSVADSTTVDRVDRGFHHLAAVRHPRRQFSQWGKIFKDPMTTAAAIDRIVHHATILELPGRSIREDEAQKRLQDSPDAEAPA